jgi:anti-anti-sigma factor
MVDDLGLRRFGERDAEGKVMVISSRTPEGESQSCPVCGHENLVVASDPAGDVPCPNCGHLLWFEIDRSYDNHVIRVTSEQLQSTRLKNLVESMTEEWLPKLVLDFQEVRYLDSDSLGRLISLRQRRTSAGVRSKLRIVHVHPDLLEVFRITRLDMLFDLSEA